jgi:hypothetical protein
MPKAKLSNPKLESLLQKGLAALAAPEPNILPAREAYRRAASVLAAFDPSRLKPYGAPPDEGGAMLHLLEDSTVLRTHREGATLWALKPEVRREALKALWAEGGFQGALRANTPEGQEQTVLQRVFEKCLRLDWPPVQAMSRDELQCALVAMQWLEGVVPELPPTEPIRKRLDRIKLLSQFEHLTTDGFAGRKAELDDLRNHVGVRKAETLGGSVQRLGLYFFGSKSRAPLALWGPGGVGKSTLVAQFLLEHATLNEEAQFPYAYLDFDNGAIGLERSAPLLNEVLRQLQLQYPDQAPSIERFGRRTRDFLKGETQDAVGSATLGPKGERAQTAQARCDEFFMRGLARLVRQIVKAEYGDSPRPFLVVLDTFENVQHVGDARVRQIWGYLDLLREHLPSTRVVVAGRDELKTKGLPGPTPQVVVLGDLDREAADAVLEKQGVHDKSKYPAIYRQTGGNPLSLRLAAANYRQGSLDTSFTATVKAQLTRWRPSGESLVQGQLYERILGNIPDENVRRLANPGLALRLVSAPVIMKVLREPCGIDVQSMAEAEQLLEKLEKASLVEREGDALRHRPDVRRVMLGPLDQAHPGLVRQINERAVGFYEQEAGLTARTEEIYHRLRLGQEHQLIAARWEPGVEEMLRGAMDELPIKSQAFLASRLGMTLTEEQLQRLTPDEWEQAAATQALNLLAHGMFDDVRRLLAERPERSPNSPLYLIEAELAVADGQLNLAQEKLELAQQAALDAGDTTALLRAVYRAAEVALKADDPVLADRLAGRAAEVAAGNDALARLRALLFRLDVQTRLTRADLSAAIKAQVAETFREVLQGDLWQSARGLIRQTARALAGDFPDLFFEAFRIAGFGRLPMQASVSVISSLYKWAKEEGHQRRLLSLALSRGLHNLEFVGEVVNGEVVHQQPSYDPQQVSAVVEELLADMPANVGLQKVIAQALGDPEEQREI